MFTSFPLDDALDVAALPSWSPSLSLPAFTPGGATGGGPGGAFIIIAPVAKLLTAPIALIAVVSLLKSGVLPRYGPEAPSAG